jgi:ATP-dependent Lhr-like helicase
LRAWSREEALVELIRGRMTITGPTTAGALATSLSIPEPDIETALLALESEGAVLRGTFTPRESPSGPRALEWCDRRLLARIHRYTLNRLRAEIEPVTAADFMRFLFAWHHVAPSTQLSGLDGLQIALAMLDGYEVAAKGWERHVLPARMDRYDPSMLDMLCLTGEVGWARLSPVAGSVLPVGATPVALFLREHCDAWQTMRGVEESSAPALTEDARRVVEVLGNRGASFSRELATICALGDKDLHRAIAELVAMGLIASDGFAGLRSLVDGARGKKSRADVSGRWSVLSSESPADREAAVEVQARVLLNRYGVVFRRLLARESNVAPWRELTKVYRRLESRGEIRGGRFVSGMSGEQFASSEAVERLREVRRERADGRLVVISAADPLNLVGIVTADERVRAVSTNRIAYRDGIAVSVMEGDYLRPLSELDPAAAMEAAIALAGRSVPVTSGFVGSISSRTARFKSH